MFDSRKACEQDDGCDRAVLIVEDEILVRFLTAEILREHGFSVLEAGDADEALQFLRTVGNLALLLTDIRMPGRMDGLALADAARAMRPGLPIVIMSSHLEAELTHRADSFLAKPFLPSCLFEVVDRLTRTEWKEPGRERNAS